MKIEQGNPVWTPITITLETEMEARNLLLVLEASLKMSVTTSEIVEHLSDILE